MNETGRFQRWQKIAIDQLTYALNLFLALTIAVLAYWFSLLRDDGFIPEATAKCLMVLSLLALAVSVICGLVCVVLRLVNFRGTAQRARDRDDAPSRDELRGLGRLTWNLFYIHLAGFGFGVLLLAIALLLTNGGRLA